jgi:vacuolar-type H+-ATPase subunit C/Vma6
MTMPVAKDLDFLSARLHGRRARLAEGARLDELSRVGTVAELARTLDPASRLRSARDLQAHLVQECAEELSRLAAGLSGAEAAFLNWQRVRFQLENLKVLARGFSNGLPLERLLPHMAALPDDLALNADALVGATSVEALAEAAPRGPLQEGLRAAREAYQAQPRPFTLETALDRAYLKEALRLALRLAGPERLDVRRLAGQEADIFHLMLVVRGVFHYKLAPERLLPLHLAGSALSGKAFAAMLQARDLQSVAALAVGRVLDAAPAEAEAAALETQAWNRFLRLANALFRHSHMGAGVVIGYAAIRRVELANLITLSEGLRIGLNPRLMRALLIPRHGEGADHV